MAPQLFTQSLSDMQLANMLQVATWLLVPVGILLVLLLYKLSSLLQYALEFFSIARFDIVPIIQDARIITAHAANLSKKVDSGAQTVQDTVDKVKPYITNAGSYGKLGIHKLKLMVVDGISSLLATDKFEDKVRKTTVNKSTVVTSEGGIPVVETKKTTLVQNP